MLSEIQNKELNRYEDDFFLANPKMYIEAGTGVGHAVFARPLIRRYVEAYIEKFNSGIASRSVFDIVVGLLKIEKKIVELKGGDESNATDEIAQAIRDYESGKTPTSAFWKLYRSNAQLRDAYDQFLLGQTAPKTEELTAAGFHSIPARVAQHKLLTDPAFRKSVDKLISEGKI